jgi:hypothetical protein
LKTWAILRKGFCRNENTTGRKTGSKSRIASGRAVSNGRAAEQVGGYGLGFHNWYVER